MLQLMFKGCNKLSQDLKDVQKKSQLMKMNKNIKHIRICIKREQLEKKGLFWRFKFWKPTYIDLWTTNK